MSARYVHRASFAMQPDAAAMDRLAQFQTYGYPATPAHLAAEQSGALALCVMQRLGRVSPCAFKATNIARNCGLLLHRVGCLVGYRWVLKSGLASALLGKPSMSTEQQQAVAEVLHDRMSESMSLDRQQATTLCWRRPKTEPLVAQIWIGADIALARCAVKLRCLWFRCPSVELVQGRISVRQKIFMDRVMLKPTSEGIGCSTNAQRLKSECHIFAPYPTRRPSGASPPSSPTTARRLCA